MNAIFNPVVLPRVQSIKGGGVYISYRCDGRRVYYDLHEADEADRRDFIPKEGCALFRLHSGCHDSWPIVCINLERSLVYFLNDYDEPDSDWSKRGIKLDFNLLDIIQKPSYVE